MRGEERGCLSLNLICTAIPAAHQQGFMTPREMFFLRCSIAALTRKAAQGLSQPSADYQALYVAPRLRRSVSLHPADESRTQREWYEGNVKGNIVCIG